MKPNELTRALETAVDAARAAGELMRRNHRATKRIAASSRHDIKLELDVRCQRLIERRLRRAFPHIGLLGEEGDAAVEQAGSRWVVDPIDGTVNFAYGIPHACVSIALELADGDAGSDATGVRRGVLGVVYDPFCDELWTALRGRPARLNGRPIRVSTRTRVDEAIISIGAGRRLTAISHMVETLRNLIRRVRKLRSMGSAALALTYVASGRFDAYAELGLNWWDIAAGAVIIESAGGRFECRALRAGGYELLAHNGPLGPRLKRLLPPPTP